MDEHNKFNEESRLHRDNYIQLCRAPTESRVGEDVAGVHSCQARTTITFLQYVPELVNATYL